MEQNTQDRYFDYLQSYINSVSELSQELEAKCQRRSSGDITIKRKKYMFFKKQNGVTLINKDSSLELSLSFNNKQGITYFEKSDLHNHIESDLNVSGLGRFFPSNKTARSTLYNECLDRLISTGIVEKKGSGYTIADEEID